MSDFPRLVRFALARVACPRPAPGGYGQVTLPLGYRETAGSPASRCPEPTVWGHDRQEMTDLAEPDRGQYSFLMSKKEPRMVPASFDFCLANLNREASSAGTSIPSESLNPTARFSGSSTVYITLIDRPLS